MSRKITWREPSDTSVTDVEINKCETKFGTYTVLATIDATSDGAAKSSSNTWVTSYTDPLGTMTHWYKLRFYDASAGTYSDYSDPVTGNEKVNLCTVDDVKKVIDTVGRFTDAEIYDAIVCQDDLIYYELGKPIQAIYSNIGKIGDTVQTMYYVGEEKLYRIDRVFYGTTTKTELQLNDGYRVNVTNGMIDILPLGSSGITPAIENDIEIHYVPGIINKYCIYRAARQLLENPDVVSNGKASKELEVIERRLKEIESIIQNKFLLQNSLNKSNYDSNYGVNLKYLVQDHDRNAYYAGTAYWRQ